MGELTRGVRAEQLEQTVRETCGVFTTSITKGDMASEITYLPLSRAMWEIRVDPHLALRVLHVLISHNGDVMDTPNLESVPPTPRTGASERRVFSPAAKQNHVISVMRPDLFRLTVRPASHSAINGAGHSRQKELIHHNPCKTTARPTGRESRHALR